VSKLSKGENYGAAITPNREGLFHTDGEGYQVLVLRNDDAWRDPSWDNIVMPYTDILGEMAPTPETDRWPTSIILTDEETTKLLTSGD
jgi:hypothetical protein